MSDYDRVYWWDGKGWNPLTVRGETKLARRKACDEKCRGLQRDGIPHVRGCSTIGPPEGPPR